MLFNNPNSDPLKESEDCLYLNIYTPRDVTPASHKAVMFWIFGVCVRYYLSTRVLLKPSG